jgi:hypothetical protein
MKSCPLAIALLLAIGFLAGTTRGQTMERKSFEAKMYSIEAIDHFGVSDDKFAALTDVQKQGLVEARNDLIALLRAIQYRRDVTKFVTHEMVSKYRTSSALAASLIAPETSILAAGVSDFALVDKGIIKLNFFAMVSSEGDIVVSEKTAVLKDTDSGWRFAGYE